MYPATELMWLISPLEALPEEGLNESPLRTTYTITLGLHRPF
jgi:hypothetical protein